MTALCDRPIQIMNFLDACRPETRPHLHPVGRRRCVCCVAASTLSCRPLQKRLVHSCPKRTALSPLCPLRHAKSVAFIEHLVALPNNRFFSWGHMMVTPIGLTSFRFGLLCSSFVCSRILLARYFALEAGFVALVAHSLSMASYMTASFMP